MNNILNWIKEVRRECQKIIERDLNKIVIERKKGNMFETKYFFLLDEIREQERDNNLLSLIQEMIEEEIGGIEK